MTDHIKVIQFKSQKIINKDRQERLDQRKLAIRRRVDAIKNSDNKQLEKV